MSLPTTARNEQYYTNALINFDRFRLVVTRILSANDGGTLEILSEGSVTIRPLLLGNNRYSKKKESYAKSKHWHSVVRKE